nr:putative leucine-rich repeat-containing protein [Quercus suber]
MENDERGMPWLIIVDLVLVPRCSDARRDLCIGATEGRWRAGRGVVEGHRSFVTSRRSAIRGYLSVGVSAAAAHARLHERKRCYWPAPNKFPGSRGPKAFRRRAMGSWHEPSSLSTVEGCRVHRLLRRRVKRARLLLLRDGLAGSAVNNHTSESEGGLTPITVESLFSRLSPDSTTFVRSPRLSSPGRARVRADVCIRDPYYTTMDSEDGQNLAQFVHTHERALANALQSQRRRKHGSSPQSAPDTSNTNNKVKAIVTTSSASITLAEALSRPYLFFSSPSLKAAKLSLTPHHLYYLLSRFEDLGVDVGPMKVRLEDLHSNAAPSEYMSFLGQAPTSRGKQSDVDSLKSVSSMRSVMSSMSSFLANLSLSNSEAKAEKLATQFQENVRYLYSCFTKIPALRLAPDHKVRPIAGYEAFPFDTAVPLYAFKNVSALEVCDVDFRQFFGWHWVAQNLRSLTVKRGYVDSPRDLLEKIILDDLKGRREHASRSLGPTTPLTNSTPFWPTNSPRSRHGDLSRSVTSPESPLVEARRGSLGSSYALARGGSSDGSTTMRKRSDSPGRPISSRHGSLHKPRRSNTSINRRSSGSSGSSVNEVTPRHSSLDLSLGTGLPRDTWRCLRHLGLPENGLTSLKLDDLASVAGTLQSLDLSGNHFSEIPDLSNLTHLRALNMSNCMISSLQSLVRTPVPAITTLNLRSNRLLQLIGIERVPSLERIDLRDNRLRDPVELARLAQIPNMIDLYVVKNPFTKTYSDYRITIFNEFRKNPGYTEDVIIDTLGPIYHEKKYLIDRAKESSSIPVIIPPLDDEDVDQPSEMHPQIMPPPFEPQEHPAQLQSHRRTTSDTGPQMTRRQKKPRRRVIELTKAEVMAVPPTDPTAEHIDRILHTPSETDEPTTPEHISQGSKAKAQQPEPVTPATRPQLSSAFTTPTPAPRIRDSFDDDDSPERIPRTLAADPGHYQQNVEALKRDLGKEWLPSLEQGRFVAPQHDHNFGPLSDAPSQKT